MSQEYDAIIVGARCAGAPTAMLLARKGYRVLLVDRATFPSDTVSTHVIHAPGVAALRRWGVLDEVVASGARRSIPTRSTSGRSPSPARHDRSTDRRPAYRAARTVLDKILVDAAAGAGVEVREHFTVEDVVVRRRRASSVSVATARAADGGGARPSRGWRRRTQLAGREGRPPARSTTTSRCCCGVLHLLERPACRRLRNRRAPQPRLGRGPHQRRPDACGRRLAGAEAGAYQADVEAQLHADARHGPGVRRSRP